MEGKIGILIIFGENTVLDKLQMFLRHSILEAISYSPLRAELSQISNRAFSAGYFSFPNPKEVDLGVSLNVIELLFPIFFLHRPPVTNFPHRPTHPSFLICIYYLKSIFYEEKMVLLHSLL